MMDCPPKVPWLGDRIPSDLDRYCDDLILGSPRC